MNSHQNLLPKKVLFLVPDDASFVSQRLVMANALVSAGHEIHVACPDTGWGERIKKLGFTFHAIDLNRGGLNPFRDILLFINLIRFLRKLKPDVLQTVSIKPAIYGSIATRFTDIKQVICLVNGRGHAFDGKGLRGGFILELAKLLYKVSLLFSGARAIFQNPEDRNYFIEHGLIDEKNTRLIRGSGVDMTKFVPSAPVEKDRPSLLFVGRLMWSKGLKELFEAAQFLKSEGIKFELKIVGAPDEKNPESVSKKEIEEYHQKGLINWVGRQNDMAAFYKEADIVVLPTKYREGLPLTLLEAASTGRALVGTDMPGCREIVRDGINGLLIPPGDARALSNALLKLIQNKNLRDKFGAESSNIVTREFSGEIIGEQYLRFFQEIASASEPREF